jgi:hypothetical protein
LCDADSSLEAVDRDDEAVVRFKMIRSLKYESGGKGKGKKKV